MQQNQSVEKATFEMLCPDWDELIQGSEEFISLKDQKFSMPCRGGSEGQIRERAISNARCCLVGEAHE